MKVGALVTKFTPPKLGKELADLGVPGGAALQLALEGGASFLSVELLAGLAKFTMAKLVKFTVKPIGSHFLSFSETWLAQNYSVRTCSLYAGSTRQ